MFPNYYQPYQLQPFYQPGRASQPQGFVRVPSEDVARNWAVMPGTSVTFLDENLPYCYTKTVGISQLDGSKFEKYRLVKEESAQQDASVSRENGLQAQVPAGVGPCPEYALKSELVALSEGLDALRRRVDDQLSKNEREGGVNNGKPAD